jgi:anti-sigma factor RsiW
VLDCLIDYEEGKMPEVERLAFEHHLALCPPCEHFLVSYRATGRTLRMLKPRELPSDLASTVMAFVRARCGKRK